jgi:hypothetical protein
MLGHMTGRVVAAPALPARRIALEGVLTHLGRRLPVVAMTGLLAALFALIAPYLVVQDTWLALVSGREIVQHGLPTVNHLTVLGAGRTWTDQQWLAQLTMYGLASLGGIRLVAIAHVAAVAGAFGFALSAARVRGASARALTATTVVAAAAAPWALQMRPQGFGLLLFASSLYLLLTDPRAERRRTLLVLPLLCVWANVHGSAVLGVEVVVLYGLIAAVSGRRERRTRAFGRGVALLLLTPATLFASPYAAGLGGYYRVMLIDPPFAGHDVEWNRTHPSGLTAVFYLLVIAVLVLLVVRRSRFTFFEVATLALTGATAFFAVRGIVWFALAVLAAVPAAVSRSTERDEQLASPAGGVLAIGFAGVFAVIALALLTGQHARYGPLRPEAAAAVALQVRDARARVLADDRHADWALWSVPSLRSRLAYDVRLELLTEAEIVRLFNFEGQRGARWADATNGYGLVVSDWPTVSALIRAKHARLVYRDETTAVARLQDAA